MARDRLSIPAAFSREGAGAERACFSLGAVRPSGDRSGAKLLRVARDSLAVSVSLRGDRPRAKGPRLAARAVGPVGERAGAELLRLASSRLVEVGSWRRRLSSKK